MNDNSRLYRQEAIDHQRTRLWGEVLIVQPKSYKWLVGIFVCSTIAISIFASFQGYKRKETVSGYLVPMAGLVRVNSDRGGVISKILVEDGQLVSQGQSLVKVTFPRNTVDGHNNNDQIKDSLKRELSKIGENLNALSKRLNSDLSSVKKRLKSRKSEVKTIEAELSLILEQKKLSQKQLKGAEKLKRKGFVSESAVDNLLNRELELQQQILTRKRLIESLKTDIVGLQSDIQVNIPDNYNKERTSIERRKEALTRDLASAELSSAYTINATVDGVVGDLLPNVGETIAPGRTLLTLRPKHSELIARLLVPSRAAGLVAVGQNVKIQYDAFPYQRFGVFNGTIGRISQGVLTPNEMVVPIVISEAFYLVDIKLANQNIAALGKKVNLKPGMQLKADIVLEERTLLEWVFEPLLTITGRL